MYTYMSLNTRENFSSIGINPPLEEAFALRTWFMAEKASLSAVLKDTKTNPFIAELIKRGVKRLNTIAFV